MRGVIAGLQAAGAEVPGFDAVVHATLPGGGGLPFDILQADNDAAYDQQATHQHEITIGTEHIEHVIAAL